MSFLRHGNLSIRCWAKKPGAAQVAHSRPSSASMSSSRLFLGRLVSTRARLRFAGPDQNAIELSYPSIDFHRTANSVLTVVSA